MEKSDLLSLAREYAGKNEDLYELLGIDAITAREGKQVQRAWRKTSIRYHPDKAGAAFDADKWQRLERARDVLSDAAARDAYDTARSAVLIREEQRRAMDSKRRAMIDDLEARERGGSPKRHRDGQRNELSEAERSRMAESGRRRMEERRRLMMEAEERMRRAAEGATAHTHTSDLPNRGAEDARPAPATGATTRTDAASAGKADGYDSKIAELEAKLQEAQQRKASRKARKSGGALGPESSGSRSRSEAKAQAIPKNHPGVSELKADENKAFTESFSSSAPSSTTPAPAPNTRPRVRGDFSSTMARLRAAQAEKDRNKAQEAAQSSQG